MPNWTAEQQRAIDANGNLLVSAGAGSGKTAVLTARIVRLIRGGESINSVLCVTFTNAAAAEMKKRIEKSLARAAAEANGEEAEKLYRAARGVSAASISTLHSTLRGLTRRSAWRMRGKRQYCGRMRMMSWWRNATPWAAAALICLWKGLAGTRPRRTRYTPFMILPVRR